MLRAFCYSRSPVGGKEEGYGTAAHINATDQLTPLNNVKNLLNILPSKIETVTITSYCETVNMYKFKGRNLLYSFAIQATNKMQIPAF